MVIQLSIVNPELNFRLKHITIYYSLIGFRAIPLRSYICRGINKLQEDVVTSPLELTGMIVFLRNVRS
jgi:hypothetical protein